MRHGSLFRGLLFFILLILVISLFSQGTLGQSQEKRILDEIGEDWSTDIILLYVETPNKFNPIYRTNITDKAVLDEISAIEEAMDPQKEDEGNQDDVTFIMSISILIKELNVAPKNIVNAASEELDPVTDPGDPPGDNEYAIPVGQDEIDQLVEDIPTETLNLFVRDTNGDGIWDTGVIWIGTQGYSKGALKKLDNIINKYYIDQDASDSDFNSQRNWWVRIDSGTIHCQITNLGYTTSYESHYGMQNVLVLGLIIVVIIILVGLLTLSFSILISQEKKVKNQEKIKKKIRLTLIVFLILIVSNVLIGFVGDPISTSPKLDQMSNEMEGGQIGLLVVSGNEGPGPNDQSKGSGSMKDIDVLDAINRFENELENVRDHNIPGNSFINSPLNIIDIMKMIKVPETMMNQIPNDTIPPMFQAQIEGITNMSFWDAIHTAGQIDSIMWYYRYEKSFQDSLLNIFYNGLTFEMRRTFVREDYSGALLYLQIPMRVEDQSNVLRNEINDVVSNHQPFIAISRFVFVDSPNAASQNNALAIKIIMPFGLLAIGLIVYILLLNEMQNIHKKEKQDSEEIAVEPEAIFPDITDEEDTFYEEYLYKGPPPGYRP